MGLSYFQRFLFRYAKASLPLKISLPFILMFLGVWVAGAVSLGHFLVNKLEHDHHERAEELVALVTREINQELERLRREARLLSIQETIVQSTVDQNRIQLRQAILPLKGILDTNVITVINRDQQPLLNVQDSVLQDFELQAREVNQLLLTGVDIATTVATRDSGPPVLVGTAPIKNEQGVIGGILIGTALGDQLLTQINQSIQEQIIVLSEGAVVASTFPNRIDWGDQPKQRRVHSTITIDNQGFFAHPIYLKGVASQQFELVLLTAQQPLKEAKQTIWFFAVVTAYLGATATTLLGYWIAKRLTKPIQDITQIAQRVVQENRFDLQVTTDTEDDIGVLARALNQLIKWVGQYTHELEIAAQTLETKVEDRTQELSEALQKLQETQSQLIQTEKMSSLGQMVAGIAHEINNPISFVQGNIPYLKEYFQDLLTLIETYQAEYPAPTTAILEKQEEIELDFVLEDLDKLLGSIKVGTQRIREIVLSLRNFSRLDEAPVKDVDLHEGIDNTLLILNHRIKHQVQVIKRYGDLPRIRCLPAQLNQVFTNMIANALDAMFDADSDPKELIITTRAISADQIQISFCDSGPGIPLKVQAKIFDPFFTTKTVGQGTGLGLGICYTIIQQHQGRIAVRSEEGRGTEFLITLPINALPDEPMVNFPTQAVHG